jgi:steroid delta-isomerase-like uncharacterized protein
MTREEIVELFARREAAFNEQDVDGFVATFAEDAVVESPFGGTHQGRAAITAVIKSAWDAFSDLTVRTDDLIIDGDRVVHVFTLSAIDTGGLMGMAPSGKPALLPMVFVCRVADGFVKHERRIYDFTGMLVQLGVLKAKPA